MHKHNKERARFMEELKEGVGYNCRRSKVTSLRGKWEEGRARWCSYMSKETERFVSVRRRGPDLDDIIPGWIMVAPNIPIRMLENPTESAIPVTAPVQTH